MNRDDFNNLLLEEQIDYFNNLLKSVDENFNAICKSIGISKNTILSRFKKEAYEPLKKGQKIIGFYKDGETKSTKVTQKVSEVKEKVNDPNDINLILKRLEKLEKEIKELKGKNCEVPNSKFIIDKFSDGTVTKTFKIDIKVNKELDKVMSNYWMYKKQDVVSSLLKYAIDNIK